MLSAFLLCWAREVFCCLRATVCFFGRPTYIDCFVFLTFQRAENSAWWTPKMDVPESSVKFCSASRVANV